MIRHIVLIKVRPDIDGRAIAAIMQRLDDLRAMMPGMVGFAAGTQVSPERLGRGFTHAFTCDFADAAARDAYLVDPRHQAIGAEIVAVAEGGLDGLVVVDIAIGGPGTQPG